MEDAADETSKQGDTTATQPDDGEALSLAQAFIKALMGAEKQTLNGQVLAIASVASYVSIPLLTQSSSSYAASKHAMRAHFDTMAAEESSWLRTDVTCPGYRHMEKGGRKVCRERPSENSTCCQTYTDWTKPTLLRDNDR